MKPDRQITLIKSNSDKQAKSSSLCYSVINLSLELKTQTKNSNYDSNQIRTLGAMLRQLYIKVVQWASEKKNDINLSCSPL